MNNKEFVGQFKKSLIDIKLEDPDFTLENFQYFLKSF